MMNLGIFSYFYLISLLLGDCLAEVIPHGFNLGFRQPYNPLNRQIDGENPIKLEVPTDFDYISPPISTVVTSTNAAKYVTGSLNRRNIGHLGGLDNGFISGIGTKTDNAYIVGQATGSSTTETAVFTRTITQTVGLASVPDDTTDTSTTDVITDSSETRKTVVVTSAVIPDVTTNFITVTEVVTTDGSSTILTNTVTSGPLFANVTDDITSSTASGKQTAAITSNIIAGEMISSESNSTIPFKGTTTTMYSALTVHPTTRACGSMGEIPCINAPDATVVGGIPYRNAPYATVVGENPITPTNINGNEDNNIRITTTITNSIATVAIVGTNGNNVVNNPATPISKGLTFVAVDSESSSFRDVIVNNNDGNSMFSSNMYLMLLMFVI